MSDDLHELHDDLSVEPPRTTARPGAARRRRAIAAIAIAGLATLGACAQDTSEGGVAPADQDGLPSQQPGGGDDPTLSGDDTGGVGGGETGGDGAGGSGSEDG